MTPFQGFLVILFRATPQHFARYVLACELLDSEAFVFVRPVSIAKSYRKFSVTCSWRANRELKSIGIEQTASRPRSWRRPLSQGDHILIPSIDVGYPLKAGHRYTTMVSGL